VKSDYSPFSRARMGSVTTTDAPPLEADAPDLAERVP
jgi:hypothetical protein